MVLTRVGLAFLLFYGINGSLKDFKMPKYGNALSRATIDIIEQFYVPRTNTLNIFHASDELKLENLERNYDTINEILYQVRSKIVVQLEGYLNVHITNQKRVYNIMFIDSYESFKNIFRLLSPNTFNYQGFYLLVLTTYSDDQYRIMTRIFEFVWAEYIVNISIIWGVPQYDEEAILYTFFPYTSFFCGKVFPIQQNQFRFGEWLHKDAEFFPKKMENIHGCPLIVAVIYSPPFMILKTLPNGEIYTDGLDGVLLRVLSQKMNFKISCMIADSQGVVSLYGNSTGAAQMIVEKRANLSIGYFASTVKRTVIMSSSYVYYTSNLVWTRPPGRLFTSFEKLFKPFGSILWFCIFVFFVLCFLAIRYIQSKPKKFQTFILGPNNAYPCLNISNIFFGGSLPRLPPNNFARFLLAIFFIYCLVIRSSYQGALFNFMRSTSRDKGANTIQEMAKENYTFYVVDSSEEFVIGSPEVMANPRFIGREEIAVVHRNLLNDDFKGALLSSEEHIAFNNKAGFPDKYFHFADEVFFVFNLVIFLHRQSCLTEEINRYILIFGSNGLLDTWMQEFVDRSYLKERVVTGPKRLEFEQLLGSFELLVIGLSMSCVTFMFEILSKCSFRLRKLISRIN